jgi:uncharacterized protein DUF6379
VPTSYMKLPHEQKVLRSDALRSLTLNGEAVGFTLDVGLNYYRGLPLSAVERFQLTIDGEVVPDHLVLVELNEKLFMPEQLALAFTEFWGVKRDLRIRVFNGGLAEGPHHVAVELDLRCVYMELAPGSWGMIDGSADRELVLQEEER